VNSILLAIMMGGMLLLLDESFVLGVMERILLKRFCKLFKVANVRVSRGVYVYEYRVHYRTKSDHRRVG